MTEPSLGLRDISKIGDLFKIMKEPDSEQKFINYLENNKSLLKAKSSILPGEGNIFHMLAMGEKNPQNPEVGCITLPWLYSGYKGYIENFSKYLQDHPTVMNYIRENIPDALVAKNIKNHKPIDFAIYCKNQVMIDILRQEGGKIKTQRRRRRRRRKTQKKRRTTQKKRRTKQKRRK